MCKHVTVQPDLRHQPEQAPTVLAIRLAEFEGHQALHVAPDGDVPAASWVHLCTILLYLVNCVRCQVQDMLVKMVKTGATGINFDLEQPAKVGAAGSCGSKQWPRYCQQL